MRVPTGGPASEKGLQVSKGLGRRASFQQEPVPSSSGRGWGPGRVRMNPWELETEPGGEASLLTSPASVSPDHSLPPPRLPLWGRSLHVGQKDSVATKAQSCHFFAQRLSAACVLSAVSRGSAAYRAPCVAGPLAAVPRRLCPPATPVPLLGLKHTGLILPQSQADPFAGNCFCSLSMCLPRLNVTFSAKPSFFGHLI